jgi:hypothetical protein
VSWKPVKPTMWYQALEPLPPALSQTGIVITMLLLM